MQNFGKIPVSWNMDNFKELPYKLDPDLIMCEEYVAVGHHLESMKFYNYHPKILLITMLI